MAAINDGRVPPVRALGGIGTGDIAVLGEVALCLLGERPWLDGESWAMSAISVATLRSCS